MTGSVAFPPGPCRLLALAPNAWDGQWMNRQQILSRLAEHHQILYSTGPWSWWDRQAAAYRNASLRGGYDRRDGVTIDRPPKLQTLWPRFPSYDRWTLRRVQRRWRSELDRFGCGPLVAWIFHPRYLRFIDGLRPDHIVYQPYDLFSRMPGWSASLESLERRLLRSADAVIATSEPTRATLESLGGRRVYCVPNGVDEKTFLDGTDRPVPGDLASIPHPRIGYAGSLNQKVDLPLIASLAEREAGWQFVLIGPLGKFDAATAAALDACRALPNVHLLGPRDRTELPGYMRGMDVNLMCYRLGTWMDSAYPLKLHEYLASGPPVVSADIPTVRPFGSVVAVAPTDADWHRLIEAALRTGGPASPQERRRVAADNTWSRRVIDIRRILDQVCAPDGPETGAAA